MQLAYLGNNTIRFATMLLKVNLDCIPRGFKAILSIESISMFLHTSTFPLILGYQLQLSTPRPVQDVAMGRAAARSVVVVAAAAAVVAVAAEGAAAVAALDDDVVVAAAVPSNQGESHHKDPGALD